MRLTDLIVLQPDEVIWLREHADHLEQLNPGEPDAERIRQIIGDK